MFDVLVMPNLYGDILSDVATKISGSVRIAGSANIGDHRAMFEAIHGSAPKRAGQNSANPSALLLSRIMMLAYLNEAELATRIHNAWLCTLEAGIHTNDVYNEKTSKIKVGTQEFAEAVARNLGNKLAQLKSPIYKSRTKLVPLGTQYVIQTDRILKGTDVYLFSKEAVNTFVKEMTFLNPIPLQLHMITNRVQKFGQKDCLKRFVQNGGDAVSSIKRKTNLSPSMKSLIYSTISRNQDTTLSK